MRNDTTEWDHISARRFGQIPTRRQRKCLLATGNRMLIDTMSFPPSQADCVHKPDIDPIRQDLPCNGAERWGYAFLAVDCGLPPWVDDIGAVLRLNGQTQRWRKSRINFLRAQFMSVSHLPDSRARYACACRSVKASRSIRPERRELRGSCGGSRARWR